MCRAHPCPHPQGSLLKHWLCWSVLTRACPVCSWLLECSFYPVLFIYHANPLLSFFISKISSSEDWKPWAFPAYIRQLKYEIKENRLLANRNKWLISWWKHTRFMLLWQRYSRTASLPSPFRIFMCSCYSVCSTVTYCGTKSLSDSWGKRTVLSCR